MPVELVHILDTEGARPVGQYGRKVSTVYRHTFTMPEYADYVEQLPRHCSRETLRLARQGWDEYTDEVMEVCDRAVKLVETECEVFEPVHALTGMCVDVGAAVAGLPEDMIDFPLQSQTNLDRVISLAADVQCLANVSDDAVRRRGFVIAGLAMALNRIGYQTNYWVSDEYFTPRRPSEKLIIRVQVKGPNDMIDPARIMFAFAHPGVQRDLGFATAYCEPGNDGEYGMALTASLLGPVTPTTQDIPDCLYLPPMYRNSDSPNADEEIRRLLMQLGLIPGDIDD